MAVQGDHLLAVLQVEVDSDLGQGEAEYEWLVGQGWQSCVTIWTGCKFT